MGDGIILKSEVPRPRKLKVVGIFVHARKLEGVKRITGFRHMQLIIEYQDEEDGSLYTRTIEMDGRLSGRGRAIDIDIQVSELVALNDAMRAILDTAHNHNTHQLNAPRGMSPDEFANRLEAAAQTFDRIERNISYSNVLIGTDNALYFNSRNELERARMNSNNFIQDVVGIAGGKGVVDQLMKWKPESPAPGKNNTPTRYVWDGNASVKLLGLVTVSKGTYVPTMKGW